MLRDAPTAGRRRRSPADRIHYRPAAERIPDEPGRVLTIAAVSLSREVDGMQWIWDDRIETGVALLKRIAYKRAHGEKSAVFACAFAELVYALGAAGGFPRSGPPPRFRGPEWDDYFKRNRTTAQRWCQRAHASGLLAVVGENDNTGQWWRVLVRVLAVTPADVDAERVSDASDRVKGFPKRRERSDRRGVVRDLRKLAAGAEPLSAAEKKRRRLSTQKANARRALHQRELLRQPKEAEHPTGAPQGRTEKQTSTSPYTSQRRGAHARRVPPLRGRFAAHPAGPRGTDAEEPWTPYRDNVTEGEGRSTGAAAGADGLSDPPRQARAAHLTGSGKLQGSGAQLAVQTAQIAAMAPTSDRLTPPVAAAIVETWWRLRRGLTAAALPVVDDTAALIDELGAWRRRAAALERLADHRPPGWPTSGAAMLLTLAVIRDLTPGSMQLGDATDELLQLMHHDQATGGRAIRKPSSLLPPQVPAGYEGITTMRRRLTEQLEAAGDSIDAYPTLAAAERAAIAHENSGRLSLGAPEDWDAPWNRDKPQPTLWQPPSVQRSWRHRLLPPLPADFAPAPSAFDHLAEPATYTAAIARIRSAEPGTKVTRHVAEDLLQAWHAERFGIAGAIAVRKRWRPKGGLAEIQAAVDAYEALAEHRPAGWPASGLAALLVTATWRDPGSYEHDGTPVRLQRPDKLPMALGLLRLITDNMDRLAKRGTEVQRGRERRRGRGGRSAEHHARRDAKRAAHATAGLRMNFRIPAAAVPALAETPAQTYQRVRRQLLAVGHHPADFPSLEDAELALIDLEDAGQLPADIGPSPAAAREARFAHARSTGPAAIAAAEWEHLAAAAAQLLAAGDAQRLAGVQPVSIHDGRLILTGSAETLQWAKAAHLTRLLEHVGRQLDVAHSAVLIAEHHASVFAPTAELRGPADHRSARADRYADERLHRFAVEGRS